MAPPMKHTDRYLLLSAALYTCFTSCWKPGVGQYCACRCHWQLPCILAWYSAAIVKSVLDPLNVRTSAVSGETQPDHVEPTGQVVEARIVHEKVAGASSDFFLLGRCDRFHCSAMGKIATKSDFDEHQRILVQNHQVDFPQATLVVSLNQIQPSAGQKVQRQVFA